MPKRKVLDLFSGTGSSTAAFEEDDDYEVMHVEIQPDLVEELNDRGCYAVQADVLTLEVEWLSLFGPFHGIWASPPCTAFSVASIGTHWTKGDYDTPHMPKTEAAAHGQRMVAHTIKLIAGLSPAWWVMENPRGMLRTLEVVRGLPRATVTYCQYGDERMKPTDLWGKHPAGWVPRPACKNGDKCHTAAPRGARTGTQGRVGAKARSMVPYELSRSLHEAASRMP